MIHVGVDFDFSQVLSVLEACVVELSWNKFNINNPVSEEDTEEHIVSVNKNFVNIDIIIF